MCGIAGGTFDGFRDEDVVVVEALAEATLQRGSDGFGIVVSNGDFCWEYRTVSGVDWYAVRAGLHELVGAEGKVHVVMCARAQPLPEADSAIEVLQPYMNESKRFALVHNGTISNDRELWKEMGQAEDVHPGIDTMVVSDLLEQHARIPTEQLVGGYAFAYIDRLKDRVELVKNIKTLWVSRVPADNTFLFASEPEWLAAVVGAVALGTPTLERLPAFTHWNNEDGMRKVEAATWSSTPDLDAQKAVIVTSGGIDSVTAAYIAQRVHGMEIVLLNFPHGQRAEHAEWAAVQSCAKDLDVEAVKMDMHWMGELGCSPLTNTDIELPLGMLSAESTLCWTPGRNMTMISAAAAYAEAWGAKWVYYGNNMEEEATAYGDNDLDFVYLYNMLLEYGTLKGVQIKRALCRLMKPEILQVGKHLGVPYGLTWSCDEGRSVPAVALRHDGSDTRELFVPCGRCGCCTTRRYAFRRAGIEDEQSYVFDLVDTYPWYTGDASKDAKKYYVPELLERVS
jgi:7-cyano-7-deazaguanine synthase